MTLTGPAVLRTKHLDPGKIKYQYGLARMNRFHQITTVNQISVASFKKEFVRAKAPVVIKQLLQEQCQSGQWRPEMLMQCFGDRSIILQQDNRYLTSTLRSFILHCANSVPGAAQRDALYLKNAPLSILIPELDKEVSIPNIFLPNMLDEAPVRYLFAHAFDHPLKLSTELFIGGLGAGFSRIHRDRFATHAWIGQLWGTKQIWLANQDDATMYLSPENSDHSQVNSLSEPDLTRFPRFAKAPVFSAMLEPGDVVFVPSGWWHSTECRSLSISISNNFVDSSNSGAFMRGIPRVTKWPAKRLCDTGIRIMLEAYRVAYRIADLSQAR